DPPSPSRKRRRPRLLLDGRGARAFVRQGFGASRPTGSGHLVDALPAEEGRDVVLILIRSQRAVVRAHQPGGGAAVGGDQRGGGGLQRGLRAPGGELRGRRRRGRRRRRGGGRMHGGAAGNQGRDLLLADRRERARGGTRLGGHVLLHRHLMHRDL